MGKKMLPKNFSEYVCLSLKAACQSGQASHSSEVQKITLTNGRDFPGYAPD
jgi:hypothetical protein